MADKLVIRGAREHNLRNVSLELPREAMVVLTGLSGSGKSSLAFDTIYAEGQRRYVESLSAYARQFLGQMDKPDVDFIDGLSPAISIDQKTASRNPRSTVGTITEVYDYLRLLFARIGQPHDPETGEPLVRQTPQQIVDKVLQLPEGSRLQVLAPVVRGRKGTYEQLFADLTQQGFARVVVDGEQHELGGKIDLGRYEVHTIKVVVDRLVLREGIERRLTDSLETALRLAEGVAEIELLPKDKEPELLIFSQHLARPSDGKSFEELAPRSFSFNSPYGACERCDGLGTRYEVDPELVVPDPDLTLEEGAIAPFAGARAPFYARLVEAVAAPPHPREQAVGQAHRPPAQHPPPGAGRGRAGRGRLQEPLRAQALLPGPLRGRGPVPAAALRRGRHRRPAGADRRLHAGGALPRLRRGPAQAAVAGRHRGRPQHRRAVRHVHRRRHQDAGQRRAVRARPADRRAGDQGGQHPPGLPVRGRPRLPDPGPLGRHAGRRRGPAHPPGQPDRLRAWSACCTCSTSRRSASTSGTTTGSSARSSTCGSWATPSWSSSTTRTRSAPPTGWSTSAPGRGSTAGWSSTPARCPGLLEHPTSLTGQYLSGRRSIEVPDLRRPTTSKWLTVRGARENNLRNIDVRFPLGVLTAVTGVSGSGKSTLVNEILFKSLMQRIYRSKHPPGLHRGIDGLQHLDKVIAIDQSPIGRTPRSNPATYTGVFDYIRRLFAATTEAKVRGYQPGRFSFNVKGGRCEACAGDGTIKIEMHFLPDVYVPCEVCKGARYNRDTLDIRFKGKNIAEVLDLPCDEAVEFFANQPAISRYLVTLVEVGLGYVRLGQPAPTLSGGEAQRVKLATELAKRSTGHTIYILDEPTTGLHFEDVRKLLGVLNGLVDQGNTVVVIEHNLDVIKTADWVVDLGPEGGSGGGMVVAEGTPEDVARSEVSHTGRFIAPLLLDERVAATSA